MTATRPGRIAPSDPRETLPQDRRPAEAAPADPITAKPTPGNRFAAWWRTLGPYLVACVLLGLGYLHYLPGVAYRLSPDAYRDWAFPAFRYSDIVWLYLRDHLQSRPVPYVDYPLEYPPLTGLLSYGLSYAPGLPAYYALAYALLALSALVTTWALKRVPGANPWLVAAAPALFFYAGHQWDLVAVAVTALSVLAVVRGRERWGALGLAVGISLKLFPVAFVAALLLQQLLDRRWRAAAWTVGIVGLATFVFNAPFALANWANWRFFIDWNRDRLADSGIWVLLRGQPTALLTQASLALAVLGGAALVALACARRGPVFVPLGATALLWWLAVNKTFTTHLMLWVLLAVALLRVPWWLWGMVVAADVVGFQVGNYLNLYNVPDYHDPLLIRKAVENVYDPLQVARSLVLFVCVGFGARILWQRAWPASPPQVEQSARVRIRPLTRLADWLTTGTGIDPELIGPALPASLRQRLAIGAAVVAAFTVAAVGMTWPYALHLRTATVVGFDPLLQVWLSQWVQHALATDPRNLFNANIFHPFALTLAYTDANIPGALLAAPVDRLTGDPILTNSLMVLASFVLAGTGVYALVTRLTGNRAAGLLSGLAYAFLAFRYVHLWHLNWLQSGWLPWILLALLATLERPTVWRGLLLGLLAAVQVLTSFYFALQIVLLCALPLAAAMLARPELRRPALYRALAVATVVAIAICLPLTLPYLHVRDEQGLERTLAEAEQYKATPDSYLQIAPWAAPTPLDRLLSVRPGPNEALATVGHAPHADGHQHPEIVIEDALFPGTVALVFAVVGLVGWRRQRWFLAATAGVAATAFALSLGPTLGPPDGTGQPLPYGFLFDHLPFFKAMRVPARLGGLVGLALAILAGFGFAALLRWERGLPLRDRAGRWVPAATCAVLATLLLAELAAVPIPLEEVDRSPAEAAAHAWLATQPPGVVMEFPAESIFADPAASSVRRHIGLAMYWSTLDWNPMVNGNSGFIPRSHSDLLERFVGQLPRPDGSKTGRISHVGPDTLPLLRQLGVRYLVVHRDQYRAEDWPAVETALAAVGDAYARVGDFGSSVVYRLAQPAAPVAEPKVTLYAPTLLSPDSPWGPWVGVANPSGEPSLLSLTRPAALSLTWWDAAGKFLHQSAAPVPLPVTTRDRVLLCDAVRCRAWNDADFPADLPDPAPTWRPTKPGHYLVTAALSGDHPVTCRIDLDVVGPDADIKQIAGSQPMRWAACDASSDVPVNNPGAVPFRSPPPSVTFSGDRAAVEATLVTRDDETVRGWYLLSQPGSPAPWVGPVFASPIIEKRTSPGDPASFQWLDRVGDEVPPGVYEMTFWFHHLTPDGWQHAYGTGYQLAPVVVDADHTLRWAGPVRLSLRDDRPNLVAGRSAELSVGVSGLDRDDTCHAAWQLLDPTTHAVAATGGAGPCDAPRIHVPASLAAGRYHLVLTARLGRNGDDRLTDAVGLPVVVRSPDQPGEPR